MDDATNPRTAKTDFLLTASEAAEVLETSIATFWRRVRDRKVPKPVKLGGMSRWPKSEILDVIERAKSARTARGARA